MLRTDYVKIIETVVFFPLIASCRIYDYEVFEQFEITKAGFITEQEIVSKLNKMRTNLYQKNDAIERARAGFMLAKDLGDVHFRNIWLTENLIYFQVNHVFYKTCFRDNAVLLVSLEDKWAKCRRAVNNLNFGYNVSTEKIINGAVKGIIMLSETYKLDINAFSKGYLNLRKGTENNSRQIDSLKSDDLASMSVTAFEIQWYHAGLKYLNESIRVFNKLSNEQRRELPDDFENTLHKTRVYEEYYHRMLMKKEKNADDNTKLSSGTAGEGYNQVSQITLLHHC